MASKQDILAGRAHVALYVNDSALVKGLKAAGKQLQSFGAGIAGIGGIMTAAGGAVLGPILGMVQAFSSAGSQIADMSARTGVSAENLSALGYAANQTGASMEDVEKALRKMQQNGYSADQLGAIADKMAGMTDPAERTAFAMKTFGKSGAALIPMLSGGSAGLAAFRKEAERLGLVMSSEDAAAADELGDAMDRAKASIKATAINIGAALAPAITWLADTFANTMSVVIEFVRNNRELIIAIAAVAAGVVAVGTTIVGLGGIVAMAGVALSGLAAVFSFLLSPIGLVVAAVAGLAAWFFTMTDTGRWASDELIGDFKEAFGTIKDMFGGVVDALSAGDLKLAGEIAMTGLKLAFFEATQSIRGWWIDMNKKLIDTLASTSKTLVNTAREWSLVFTPIASAADALQTLTTTREMLQRHRDLKAELQSRLDSGQITQEQYDERVRRSARNTKADIDAIGGSWAEATSETGRNIDDFAKEAKKALDDIYPEGKGEEDERITRLKEELDALRREAKEKSDAARRERENAPKATQPEGDDEPGAISMPPTAPASAVTFSGSALRAMGQGAPMDRLIKVAEEQRNIMKGQLNTVIAMNLGLAALRMAMTIE